jgi:hypothetical protein
MEFELSIIELSKRKLQLLREVDEVNRQIMFLRKQQEEYDRNGSEVECAGDGSDSISTATVGDD